MTTEERQRITSEDYADLIIAYSGDENILRPFQGNTINIINFFNAVVHVPVSQITENTVVELGYSVMPPLYGIISDGSLEASGISRLRNVPNFNLRGQGVLIGIVDTGIDYTNPIFRKADNTTKIAEIWDQTIESNNPPSLEAYGTEYLAEDINLALQSQNPFEIVPSRDEIGHGTMLAGIVAGNEVPESDFSGVAPDSQLIVVKLKQAKQILRDFFIIPPNVPCYQENDIMWGLQYVGLTARRMQKPIVFCIGLGTSQGSHDGKDTLSDFLSVISDFPGFVSCVSAGNEGNTRTHFYSVINPTIGYSIMEINVGDNEAGFSFEIWGEAPNTYSIDILSPVGEYIPRITESLRINREISFVFEKTSINVDYQIAEQASGNQLILLRLRNPTPGIWRFQVYGRGDLKSSFHAWLPMSGIISDNTYFVQADPYTTITSLGNASVPITVTAYNSDNNNLYQKSSRGYTRIGNIKPDIAAPGVNITAPALDHGFTIVSGTGAAAAHTAGVAAMIVEWGIVRGNYPGIDTVEVKKFILRGAQRNPGLIYPNRDWGYGILDVFNAFDILRAATDSS